MRSVATPGAVGLVAALLVTTVPPLPAAETFVHGAGLRIQLTVRKQTLEAFEDPNFTVRFENVGSKGIYLSPAVASNIHIYDEHGALVAPIAPTPHSVAERIGFRIRKSELIHLPPGRHWSAPVRPERSPGGAYTLRHPSDQTERFALRAGRYTARFVYVAYPGYSAHYDPYEIRNIWEGRQESEPVTFSVAPGAEAAIEGVELTARAFRQTYPDPIATITDLERQLASDEQNTVAAAASAVRGRNSKASIPALLPLLKDSRAWKRYIATFTVVALAAEGVQDHLLLLIDDADARVRMYALLSLGMHCDPEQLPVFQARFDQSLSEGVMYGIGRCGNAASFATLQPLLGAPDSGVRHRANHALRLLTFTDMNSREIPSRGYPEDWEAWYRRYGRQSRDQWALRRLKERDETQNEFGKRHALDYFFRSRDPRWLPELRRAASSWRYGVRIAAARGVLPFERAEGLSLLRRELNNRQLGACQSAAEALNRATGQQIEFDFTLPSERTRAVVAYARVR